MITFNARGCDPKTLRALRDFFALAAEEAEHGTVAALERKRETGEGKGFKVEPETQTPTDPR